MSQQGGRAAYIPLDTPIDLAATLCCGQAFRWRAAGEGAYQGVVGDRFAQISAVPGGVRVWPCATSEDEIFWRQYLDAHRDYTAAHSALRRHPSLRPAVDRCSGLRILNQPLWECLASFIVSQNNNVARITRSIEALCRAFGRDRGGYYAFAQPQSLCDADDQALAACGLGYRGPYLRASARLFLQTDLSALGQMPYEQAQTLLRTFPGVGEKVANCVLLFACGYRAAFPVDVWIARAFPQYFPDAPGDKSAMRRYAQVLLGEHAGLAQQCIFHYERVLSRRAEQEKRDA